MADQPLYRQRHYYNGKLTKSSSPRDLATLRRWLDNVQAEWSRNIMPQVKPGEFDPNNASQVNRESLDELSIITTGGHKIRLLNVEVRP